MFITSISIVREGYYGYGKNDPTKPLRATVAVEGQHGKVELNLSPEASDRMVALIAEEIVESTKATAALMTSGVIAAVQTQKIDAPKKK